MVLEVKTSAGQWSRTEGRGIEEVDLMPLPLSKPIGNYTKNSRKEGPSLLSLVLIRISKVSAHACHQSSPAQLCIPDGRTAPECVGAVMWALT